MHVRLIDLAIGALAAGAIAGGSLAARFLTRSGALATFVLGTIVFGLGGIAWSVPLVVFFLSGSLLSRFGPKRKARIAWRLEGIFEKGSTRDAAQVLANGGIAGTVVLLWAIHGVPELYTAFVGALAAAAADTWGTELGTLTRGATISPRSLRRVPAGASGGLSVAGTVWAAAGALLVAASAAAWAIHPIATVLTATAAGMAGMFADSVLGATLQAQYRCAACDAVTERHTHCDRETNLESGVRWVTNDVVNTACCLVGAGAAFAAAMWAGW